MDVFNCKFVFICVMLLEVFILFVIFVIVKIFVIVGRFCSVIFLSSCSDDILKCIFIRFLICGNSGFLLNVY